MTAVLTSKEPGVLTTGLVTVAVIVFGACVVAADRPVRLYRRIAVGILMLSFVPRLHEDDHGTSSSRTTAAYTPASQLPEVPATDGLHQHPRRGRPTLPLRGPRRVGAWSKVRSSSLSRRQVGQPRVLGRAERVVTSTLALKSGAVPPALARFRRPGRICARVLLLHSERERKLSDNSMLIVECD